MGIEGYLVRMSHSVYVAAWKTSGDLAPRAPMSLCMRIQRSLEHAACELTGCMKA